MEGSWVVCENVLQNGYREFLMVYQCEQRKEPCKRLVRLWHDGKLELSGTNLAPMTVFHTGE